MTSIAFRKVVVRHFRSIFCWSSNLFVSDKFRIRFLRFRTLSFQDVVPHRRLRVAYLPLCLYASSSRNVPACPPSPISITRVGKLGSAGEDTKTPAFKEVILMKWFYLVSSNLVCWRLRSCGRGIYRKLYHLIEEANYIQIDCDGRARTRQ